MPIRPTIDPFGDNNQHLKQFPDSALLDIARNGAAQRDYRLLAVEILQTRKSPKITHPDIQDLVHELEIELDGIVFEHPAPSTPLKASVTTATMFADDRIDNQFTGFDFDVSPTKPETIPTKTPPKEPAIDANP